MPDISAATPFSYLRIIILISGFFLILIGINIIRLEGIMARAGKKTLFVGVLMSVFSIMLFLGNAPKPEKEQSDIIISATVSITPSTFLATPAVTSSSHWEPSLYPPTPTIQPLLAQISPSAALCLSISSDDNSDILRDVDGNIISITDAQGNSTIYAYDPIGNRVQIINPLGDTTICEYDSHQQLIKVVDTNGTINIQYDSNGRIIASTDALGVIFFYDYDEAGTPVPRNE